MLAHGAKKQRRHETLNDKYFQFLKISKTKMDFQNSLYY